MLGSLGSIASVLSGALKLFNGLMDMWDEQRWKSAGMKEQRLKAMEKLHEVQKAADEARKRADDGSVFDKL